MYEIHGKYIRHTNFIAAKYILEIYLNIRELFGKYIKKTNDINNNIKRPTFGTTKYRTTDISEF